MKEVERTGGSLMNIFTCAAIFSSVTKAFCSCVGTSKVQDNHIILIEEMILPKYVLAVFIHF